MRLASALVLSVALSSPVLAQECASGKTIDWRVTEDYGCSNGVYVYAVSIPLSKGEAVDASKTTIMEDGAPAYTVLSDLGCAKP